MKLAVVVPARQAAETLPQCLTAAWRSGGPGIELLVVDDASTDGTSAAAEAYGATVLRHGTAAGPAAARNAGARAATADLVLFVDADVAIAKDAIPRVIAAFEADPDLAAVFGSYDDAPQAGAFVSDYRNLLHHFTHQNSREQSRSFWAGCGAVRQSVFLELGGFDERYHRPSIEDIEFGWRCANAEHRIRLDKELQGNHLKRWTLPEVVRIDIRDRAYPWSCLVLEHREIPRDLNLRLSDRASAVLVWIGALSAIMTPASSSAWRGGLLTGVLLSLAAVLWLNRDFYLWLARQRGIRFLAGAFWLHLLYFAYSSATFGWAWLRSTRARSLAHG